MSVLRVQPFAVAAQWHDAGARTVVRLRDEARSTTAADVLVVDTHSRQLPADAADLAVADRLPAGISPDTVLFKKIDSPWRGTPRRRRTRS